VSTEIAPEAPRERQTLRLPESELASLRAWAVDGTGLTAAARVRDPDGRIALVKNGWSDRWILPGGGVEPDEEPTEAARREVREETGLNATVGDPLVVLEQSYVTETQSRAAGNKEAEPEEFSALYVVKSATADGEIPNASRLGVNGEEISAARWFETLPENLHDRDLLRPYL
jgi:8-oxo-dGTP pyrophosphatase MutT (NUDIX family)